MFYEKMSSNCDLCSFLMVTTTIFPATEEPASFRKVAELLFLLISAGDITTLSMQVLFATAQCSSAGDSAKIRVSQVAPGFKIV